MRRSDLSFMVYPNHRRTYDETRAEATPCLGNCGKICTDGPRYCAACQLKLEQLFADVKRALRARHGWPDRFRRAQPDAHGGVE